MEKVVFEFEKSAGEMVRARLSDFGGQPRGDLRIFFETADGGWQPTKRGLGVPVDLLPKLRQAVEKLEQAAQTG